MKVFLRLLVLGIFLGVAISHVSAPVQAQSAKVADSGIDFASWDRFATQVETLLKSDVATRAQLNAARKTLVDWRARLLAGQDVNKDRIETLQSQIKALGPAPAEGTSEPEDIAARRVELDKQLAELKAPGLAAEEAHSRADGLVREVDAQLRTLQKNALLQLSPAPANPANWPDGARLMIQEARALAGEVVANWAVGARRAELRANLPLVIGYLLLAAVALIKGRRWIENAVASLQQRARGRGRSLLAFGVSLGQIVLPMIGIFALTRSVQATALFGPNGAEVLGALPAAGFAVFSARWLGTRLFPRGDTPVGAPFRLVPARQAQGRLFSTLIGVLIGLDVLRQATIPPDPDGLGAAQAVIAFPLLVLLGLSLICIGQLLRLHSMAAADGDRAAGFMDRLVGLIGHVAIVLGVAGPVFAATGYVPAATAVVYPAVISLGLFGLLLLLQQLVTDLFILISGNDEAADNALLPVLFGFFLALLSVPVFALIWGARVVDLLEVGARLQQGITIGQSQISPADFLYFLLVFMIVYGLTRLLQGALASSILPRTRMDKGASNAIVSGVGYVGVFLAGLLAFTSAGIDLSSLAIVAGALSVGIGFGLQNIVSNFVSGIILLIERPVSEGDWIEAGGHMGIVRAISVRSTRIETFDRTEVIVPNADLVSGSVINWTKSNMNGRIIVPVGVAYGTDTRRVERILREIIEAQPLVMMSPPPTVLFTGFGADSLDFEVRAILSDVNFGLSVKSDINHEIAHRFAEEGIEIPFAQRDLWLRNPETLRPPVQGPKSAPIAPEDARIDETTQRADASIGLIDGPDD
ncbi:potassium efflux system protein [Rhodobacteraceae bacterium MBR-64]